jgi:hypothetical protein
LSSVFSKRLLCKAVSLNVSWDGNRSCDCMDACSEGLTRSQEKHIEVRKRGEGDLGTWRVSRDQALFERDSAVIDG